MVVLTCTDVLMRQFGYPIVGVYDLVYMTGAVAMACALPYTTALKGHVAIEHFFHKLNRTGRILVDTIMRTLSIALFSILTWQSALFGTSLKFRGDVTATLQVPLFWIPWVISVCCAMVVFVTFFHLMFPGRELLKP